MLHRITPGDMTASDAGPNACSDFLLVCEAHSTSLTDGRWNFSIEAADGTPVLEAGDEEFGDLNRLTLLAAVRGLESIDGPASVKLLSNNRYLIRSLSDSLPRWRRSGFVWEHFGRRIDIQHADLWRRIDHALAIHRVEACLVSSRLVSSGSAANSVQHQGRVGDASAMGSPPVNRPGGSDGAFLRVDSPHATPSAPQQATASSDRLRRWLLAAAPKVTVPAPYRRKNATDLVESS